MFLILAVWEAMNDLKRRTRNMIEKRGFVPIYEQVISATIGNRKHLAKLANAVWLGQPFSCLACFR